MKNIELKKGDILYFEYQREIESVKITKITKLDGFVMPFQFSDGGAHGWKIYSTDKV